MFPQFLSATFLAPVLFFFGIFLTASAVKSTVSSITGIMEQSPNKSVGIEAHFSFSLHEVPAILTSLPEPSPADTPLPTDTPAPTDTPIATETPIVTDTPEATNTPEASDTPLPTATPEATATSLPTQTPLATDTPTSTATPLPQESPTATATDTGVPTDTPAPTHTPEATVTPLPPALPTEEPANPDNNEERVNDPTPTNLPPTATSIPILNNLELPAQPTLIPITETPVPILLVQPVATNTPVAPHQVPITGVDRHTSNSTWESSQPLRQSRKVIGQPTTLHIPAIGISSTVDAIGWQRVTEQNGSESSQWEEVGQAAGWLKNSAFPGSHGNVVIGGHNNVYGSLFRDLWKLNKGDSIYLTVRPTEQYIYVVDSVIVRPEKYAGEDERAITAAYLGTFDDSRLTLLSCWPPQSNTHRIFVIAHLQKTP